MQSEQPPLLPEQEISVEIKYQPLIGDVNPLLKGSGRFILLPSNGKLRFTGRRRTLFGGEEKVIEFDRSEIFNVVVKDSMVRFSTTKATIPIGKKAFVFYCKNAADAAAVAASLPQTADADLTANAAFYATLERLPGGLFRPLSITHILVGINTFVFVLMAALLGTGWISVTDLKPYILYGANNGAATTDGEWWRLVTSMFMHYGIMHLFMNMWALHDAGLFMERLQGWKLFAITYLAGGIGGSLLSIVWNGDKTWSAGASGAIFAVYGAMLGHLLREKRSIPRSVFKPLLKSTLVFAAYNLLNGLSHRGIDNAAHVGGFVTGIAFGWITAMPLDAESRNALTSRKLRHSAVALALLVSVGIAGTPRFNYNVRSEIAWAESLKSYLEKEHVLAARQLKELSRWQKSADNGPAFSRLVAEELVPFYRGLRKHLEGLPVQQHPNIEERRKALSEFSRLRLEGYDHLLLALKKNDKVEFRSYEELDKKAGGVIRALKQ